MKYGILGYLMGAVTMLCYWGGKYLSEVCYLPAILLTVATLIIFVVWVIEDK